MTGNDQSDELDWRGEVPVSRRFDDPYFSLNDGLAETGHVFHRGNCLPERLRDGFQIAELGFGTGLNLLATVKMWHGPGVLEFTSFEAFPMDVADMARSLAHFPAVADVAGPLLAAWGRGERQILWPGVRATILVGDARETLPQWQGRADAWFLDGFSPAKNPELWSAELMAEVARHTATGGTFATYTAAGHVRRALQDAGFVVERRPGHGHKRHMTAGYLPE